MTLDEHVSNIGKLVTNLQGLELSLRQFLCYLKNEKIDFQSFSRKTVPETHLTNYDSLGELIKKYNNVISSICPNFAIDNSVVDLRDALAHGRLIPACYFNDPFEEPAPPQRLLKFGRAQNGSVRITFDAVMDDSWFKNWIGVTSTQIHKVHKCHQEFKLLNRSQIS